tara:strand:- start:360 stop:1133 length:774 start_codon:yes stop_codon:yes gene_type:complete
MNNNNDEINNTNDNNNTDENNLQKETIAMYIDGDNVSYKDIEIILKEVNSYGRIIISRVYGDWSKDNMNNWLKTSTEHGILQVQCGRISGKNSSDIKLCVDLMKDLYSINSISLFFIITSDSDYRHIVPEIKTCNKKMFCIGESYANISLISSCDKYITLNKLKGIESSPVENNIKQIGKKAEKKIRNEIEILLKQENNIFNIKMLENILLSKYQIDYKKYGYEYLYEFIEEYFNDICSIDKNTEYNDEDIYVIGYM